MAMALRWLAAMLALVGILLLAHGAAADPGNFPKLALDPNVLRAEGGFSNHPADPGGRTLQGIIQRVYDQDRAERGLSPQTLTPALARDAGFIAARDRIYRDKYWAPCAGDALPRGLDFTVFSMCVNAGIARGWVLLMRVLALNDERPYAPMAQIRAAIVAIGVRGAIVRYGAARRAHYLALSAPGKRHAPFRNGWLTREQRETAAALQMALGTRTGATIAALPPGLLMGKAVEDAGELLEVMP